MPSVLHSCVVIVSCVFGGAVVPTPFLSFPRLSWTIRSFEVDYSIGCLLTHWRCGPCTRLCYPMSDAALLNLSWTTSFYRADFNDDDDCDDGDDHDDEDENGDDDDDNDYYDDDVRKLDSMCPKVSEH